MEKSEEPWNSRPEHVIEFRGNNGHSVTLELRAIPMELGNVNQFTEYLVRFSGGEPGCRVAAEEIFWDYLGLTGLAERLRLLCEGKTESLEMGYQHFKLEVRVRRELVRPRFWIRGHLGPQSYPDPPAWMVQFDFEWCPVDAQGPIHDTLRQVESLLAFALGLGYPY